ncbi:MAG: M48 family metallopeptidase [Nitriliruptorales bacterium]|nr:M48 family metallopeptidase [Nitriliruptorales bacterium]
MSRTVEYRPARGELPPLELVRSTRRKRTVNAFPRDGRIVVQLPAGLGSDREQELIERLVRRVTGEQRADEVGGDAELRERAIRLADAYLDGIRPADVRWSSRMQRRWGSCTPATRRIRISDRLRAAPDFVIDGVLVHELAHLLVPDHSPEFHDVVARFPEHARAQGFLEGWQFAAAREGLDDGQLVP